MTELFFLFLPIIISFLLSIKLYFFQQKNRLPAKYLGAYFFFLTLVLASVILQYQKQHFEEINNYIIPVSVIFYVSITTLPSLVYLYVLSLTGMRDVNADLLRRYLTVPFVLLLINLCALVYLGFESDADTMSVDVCKKVWNGANFVALIFLFPILSVYYLIKSFRVYINYKNKIEEVFSYNEGIDLKWMLIFLIGYLFYVISFIVLPPNSSPIFVYVPMIMYLLFIGIMGMKQSHVLFEKEVEVLDEEKVERKNEFKEKIIYYMQKEEPFLDDELTIYQLSKMLNTNTKYLSSVLNKGFDMNFTSFVNSYRIEKAKEFLLDLESKNYTIEAIGEMSGFKSKSAFNRWFKKFTQVTPSIYRDRVKN